MCFFILKNGWGIQQEIMKKDYRHSHRLTDLQTPLHHKARERGNNAGSWIQDFKCPTLNPKSWVPIFFPATGIQMTAQPLLPLPLLPCRSWDIRPVRPPRSRSPTLGCPTFPKEKPTAGESPSAPRGSQLNPQPILHTKLHLGERLTGLTKYRGA